MTNRIFYAKTAVIAFALASVACLAVVKAQQTTGEAVSIGDDDIGGVVTSEKGPEAGVWVIAETTDLPTKFVKIVVTDDRGRYVVPGLPKASYSLWVRGYGLVDSPKVQAMPGKIVNLAAVVAPNPREAAQYYPAVYWFSLLRVPNKSEFPGTGPQGNGIPQNMKSQGQWLHLLKTDSCWSCHQMGDKATREIPKSLGHFDATTAAWSRRLLSGQAGNNMINGLAQLGPERALKMFADWTDQIAAGELPPAPPRPQGVERNVVITEWDWADPKATLHDEIATDKRNPTLNADGPTQGARRRARSRCQFAIRRPHQAPTTRLWRLRRIGVTKPSGRAKPTCTTRCSMKRAECGLPPEFARATIRRSAKRDRAILPLSYSR